MEYKQIPEARAQIKKEISEGKTHKEILIHIAELFNYQSYLEIGSQNPNNCFDHIPCKYKTSVDPDPKALALHKITSKEFWELCSISPEEWMYDLIFLDGMHTREESRNDLKQALKYLSKKGTIVIHDANPWNEESQRVPRQTVQWNGDVWKTIIEHVALANHLVYTIDCDFGVCCIHPFAAREQISRGCTDYYTIFNRYKKEFLHLITLEEWYKKIKDLKEK